MLENDRPYIGVALDHGTSFDLWLERWNLGTHDRVRVKRAFVDLYLDLEVSGLVVGFDLAHDYERIVNSAAVRGTEIWVGLPDDAFTWALYDESSLGSTVSAAADSGAAGIKMGVHALGGGWDPAITSTYKWVDRLMNRGLELIVEPIFHHDDDAGLRSHCLDVFKTCSAIRYAKLDVHDPAAWSALYGDSFTPWVARSEGLEFDVYSSHLAQSLPFGCHGTMVGGAAWGISGLPVLGQEFEQELVRRVEILRSLWVSEPTEIGIEAVGHYRPTPERHFLVEGQQRQI